MNEDEVRRILEDIDPEGKIPKEKMEEVIQAIIEQEEHPLKDGDKIGDMTFHTLENLKSQMGAAPDWKTKACLAAKIISLGLD